MRSDDVNPMDNAGSVDTFHFRSDNHRDRRWSNGGSRAGANWAKMRAGGIESAVCAKMELRGNKNNRQAQSQNPDAGHPLRHISY
jgi:hypothetical protein